MYDLRYDGQGLPIRGEYRGKVESLLLAAQEAAANLQQGQRLQAFNTVNGKLEGLWECRYDDGKFIQIFPWRG